MNTLVPHPMGGRPASELQLSPRHCRPSTINSPDYQLVIPRPRVRHQGEEVLVGAGKVQLFGRAPGPWTIAWYETEASPRQRTMRISHKKAKALFEQKIIELRNRATGLRELTPVDGAAYLRALELLPPGKQLELSISEFAEACKAASAIGDGRLSIMDCVRFTAENYPRGFAPRPLPKLIEQYLAQKESEISKDNYAHLEHNLGKLAAHYTGPLHSLQSSDINTWLRGLGVGPRTRHNYRAALDQLVHWARDNAYLPRTWTEMDRVQDPGHKTGEIKILTIDQVTELLTTRQQDEESGRAQKSLVPFLALQVFAGLRHSEASRLDWRDVHLDERTIYVPKAIGKGFRSRPVPISDNLAAWLHPYAKRSGPITSLSQVSGALTKAKKRARIPAGDNETRNVLRKTFISYRKASIQNVAQVAEEAGNSVGIIHKHYGRPIPQAEGKRLFQIWPTDAAVLQLTFPGL